MKNRTPPIILFSLLALALAACDRSEPTAAEPNLRVAEEVEALPEETPEPATTVDDESSALPGNGEIHWFDGSVEQAFVKAKAENTPLFLYWGAVWCPPCVEIRNTVFKDPRFIAQTRLFLPVYLDGDTGRAQTWGDRFSTKVYPTMIVFNPAGEEVTRLHAGIDISAYNTVLGLSLERMQPTSELVQAGLEDAGSLKDADFQQLAYYSWYEDQALPEGANPALFLSLSEAAAPGNPEASARLYLQYLVMLAGRQETAGKPGQARLREILASSNLVFASWDYLIMPEALLPAAGGSEADLDALKTEWAAVMRDSRHQEGLSTKNQLYGWRPWLVFHFEGDENRSRPLPEQVREAILADVDAAAKSVAGTHSRQSVINTASNVLMLAGLTNDARALLKREIGQSKTPYYFMGSLALLEYRDGNEALSLDWRQKAYKASEGPATRIRWWASYVQALTLIAPENMETIRATAMFPFDESHGMDEIFSGANFRNLKRAAESLDTWAAEYHPDQPVLADFHTAIDSACAVQATDSTERSNCLTL